MTKNISTDAEIDSVRLTQQTAHPSSPSSGYESLYIISGSPHGGLFVKDSSGKQIGPFITGSPSAAGSGDFVKIGDFYISGSIATYINIPSTYTHLQVRYLVRSTLAGNTFENMSIYINNDTTGTNYRNQRGFVYGSTSIGADGGDVSLVDSPPAADSPAGSVSMGVVDLLYYKQTSFNKQIMTNASDRRDASSVHEIRFFTGLEWENTAAITQIDFKLPVGTFAANCAASLYGIN